MQLFLIQVHYSLIHVVLQDSLEVDVICPTRHSQYYWNIILPFFFMEDEAPNIYHGLTKRAEHLQNMLELGSQAIEQKTTLAFDSLSEFNEIKEAIFAINRINQNIQAFFTELAMPTPASIIKKILNSSYLINLHLLKACETKDGLKQKNGSATPLFRNSQSKEQPKVRPIVKETDSEPERQQEDSKQKEKENNFKTERKKTRLPKLGGISLYKQFYSRHLEKDTINSDKSRYGNKNSKKPKEEAPINYGEFKHKIFSKMEKEIKEAQQSLYHPVDDQVKSFIGFERKFIQSFNHYSRAEDLEKIVEFFHKSTLEAADFLKNTKLSQQVSRFRADLISLLKNLKKQKQDREKGIGDRFEDMLERFMIKNEQFKEKMKEKIKILEENQKVNEVIKVSVSTQTNNKELKSIKIYKAQIEQLQHKLTYFQIEKQKKFEELLEKIDRSANLIKSKETEMNLTLLKKNQEIKIFKLEIDKLNSLIKQRKLKRHFQSDKMMLISQEQMEEEMDDGDEAELEEKYGKRSRFRKMSILSRNQKNQKKMSSYVHEGRSITFQIQSHSEQSQNSEKEQIRSEEKQDSIQSQDGETIEQNNLQKFQTNEELTLQENKEFEADIDEQKTLLQIRLPKTQKSLKTFKTITVAPTDKRISSSSQLRVQNEKNQAVSNKQNLSPNNPRSATKSREKNQIAATLLSNVNKIQPLFTKIESRNNLNFQYNNLQVTIIPTVPRIKHQALPQLANKIRSQSKFSQYETPLDTLAEEYPRNPSKSVQTNNLKEIDQIKLLKQKLASKRLSESKQMKRLSRYMSSFSRRRTYSNRTSTRVFVEDKYEKSSSFYQGPANKNLQNLALALNVKKIERCPLENKTKKERAQSLVGVEGSKHKYRPSAPKLQTLRKYKTKNERSPQKPPTLGPIKESKGVTQNSALNGILKKKLRKNLFQKSKQQVELPLIHCKSYAN